MISSLGEQRLPLSLRITPILLVLLTLLHVYGDVIKKRGSKTITETYLPTKKSAFLRIKKIATAPSNPTRNTYQQHRLQTKLLTSPEVQDDYIDFNKIFKQSFQNEKYKHQKCGPASKSVSFNLRDSLITFGR